MSFIPRPGSGRPRQTSRREDHHIIAAWSAVFSVDFVLDYDGWIVRFSDSAAAVGAPGVWTAVWSVNSGCTGLTS
ncbi:hypothetical protein TNCV_1852581 [Trichonephila clavipes]|nr:hypothetical protein TNCV_1852581 [Trichonephila clavipes]